MHDDYDFVYGNEADRSDGSSAGEPITDTQDGAMYRDGWQGGDGLSHVEVSAQIGFLAFEGHVLGEDYGDAAARIGRMFIIVGHTTGKGSPFPIKVEF